MNRSFNVSRLPEVSLGWGLKPKQTRDEHLDYTQRGSGRSSEPLASDAPARTTDAACYDTDCITGPHPLKVFSLTEQS